MPITRMGNIIANSGDDVKGSFADERIQACNTKVPDLVLEFCQCIVIPSYISDPLDLPSGFGHMEDGFSWTGAVDAAVSGDFLRRRAASGRIRRLRRTGPGFVGADPGRARFRSRRERGHVVIVNFWATWCVPCRAEMPMLDAFYKKHRGEGLDIIGLSVDSPSALPKVKQVAATVSYPMAVARDAQANGFPAPNALPMTYVIDGKGEVKAVLMPEDDKGLDEAKLAKIVEPLMKAWP